MNVESDGSLISHPKKKEMPRSRSPGYMGILELIREKIKPKLLNQPELDGNNNKNSHQTDDRVMNKEREVQPMAKTRSKKKIDLVEVSRHKGKLMLPDDLSYKDAREVLRRQERFEEELINVDRVFEGFFVWDGAIAFMRAIEDKYGMAHGKTKYSFFGVERPQMKTIKTGINSTIQVPWGSFVLPGYSTGDDEELSTGYSQKDGLIVFRATGTIRRKHEAAFTDLCDRTEKILREHSIYRGSAFRIRFRDEDGVKIDIPEPQFLDLSKVDPDELVFSEDVMAGIQTSIFTPILKTDFCRQNGVPLKRGALLSGTYGTGKTLTAYVTAKYCTNNNWTFIYCDANDLNDVIMFSRQYEPVVVFCEDIDRRVTGERTTDIDSVLNTIDGLTTKSSEILTILTTNHKDNINEALLRPGRLDAVIDIHAPDQAAVEKLLRLYGRGLISAEEDLTEASKLLEGNIPAFVRECVERSKLVCIGDSNDGDIKVTGEHLKTAALGMQSHLALLNKGMVEEPVTELETAMMAVIKKAMEGSEGLDADEIIKRATAATLKKVPCLNEQF